MLTVLEARVASTTPKPSPLSHLRHPQPRATKAFWDNLDRALTAVREHRWLSFDYTPTAGGATERRTLQPYAVHAHDGRYYLWGILEGEATPKLFYA